MSYLVTQEDLNILDQGVRNLRIRAELLNSNYQAIDEIEGNIIQENYIADMESDVRNSYNVTFAIDEGDTSFQIGRDRVVWFDKYLRISVGIYYFRTKDYKWYPRGIYAMSTVNYHHDAISNQVTLSCMDHVVKLNGVRNGQVVGQSLVIPTETSPGVKNTIRGAMLSTITQLGGVTRYRIDPMEVSSSVTWLVNKLVLVPYDLEFSGQIFVWDIVKRLRDLCVGYETFFDEDDTFICQPIPSYNNAPIILNWETLQKYVISEDTSADLGSVKNCTVIYGQVLDADNYTETVSISGSMLTATYTGTPALTNNATFGFMMPANSPANPTFRVNANTAQQILGDDNQPLPAGKMLSGRSYVVKYSTATQKFYYVGSYMIVGVNLLVSQTPTQAQKNTDIANFGTPNISYTVDPESPFCSDLPDVGQIINVCEGEEWSNISTESLALPNLPNKKKKLKKKKKRKKSRLRKQRFRNR